MIDQDYVAFCNFAHELQQAARGFCSQLDPEHIRQLSGVVQAEIAAAGGKVAPAYDFLAVVLSEEVELRRAGRGGR